MEVALQETKMPLNATEGVTITMKLCERRILSGEVSHGGLAFRSAAANDDAPLVCPLRLRPLGQIVAAMLDSEQFVGRIRVPSVATTLRTVAVTFPSSVSFA